jgi:hypothetical protein
LLVSKQFSIDNNILDNFPQNSLVTWIFLTVFFLVLTIIAAGAAFKMLPFIPDCYPWFKFGGGGSC